MSEETRAPEGGWLVLTPPLPEERLTSAFLTAMVELTAEAKELKNKEHPLLPFDARIDFAHVYLLWWEGPDGTGGMTSWFDRKLHPQVTVFVHGAGDVPLCLGPVPKGMTMERAPDLPKQDLKFLAHTKGARLAWGWYTEQPLLRAQR